MPGNEIQAGKPYLSIVGGNISQKVDKDTPKAKYREYELPDGTKGGKWEVLFTSWTGKIVNITFKETKIGEMCNIELEDAVLSLNTSSRYFMDLACKLCSGDLKREFTFHPYDMEVDGGKRKTGVSLQQDGVKLKNHFYNGTCNLHGFPEVDKTKTIKKTYWKTYFIEVADFLIEKLKAMQFDAPVTTEDSLSNLDEDVSMDDLPF